MLRPVKALSPVVTHILAQRVESLVKATINRFHLKPDPRPGPTERHDLMCCTTIWEGRFLRLLFSGGEAVSFRCALLVAMSTKSLISSTKNWTSICV